MKNVIFVAALFVTTVISAQQTVESIKPTKFGNGILNFKGENDSWSIKMGARMQLLSTNNWIYKDHVFDEYAASAVVRRYRLKFDGFVYSPKVWTT